MRFTGKLLPPTIDFETRKINAVFALNEDFTQAYEELKDCDKITLEVKKYRAKRSLDANAYYWTLIYKLAKVLQITNEECHNMELRHYGQPEIYEGKGVYITIPDTPEAAKLPQVLQSLHRTSAFSTRPRFRSRRNLLLFLNI